VVALILTLILLVYCKRYDSIVIVDNCDKEELTDTEGGEGAEKGIRFLGRPVGNYIFNRIFVHLFIIGLTTGIWICDSCF